MYVPTSYLLLIFHFETIIEFRSTKKKNKHMVFVGRLAIQEYSVRK